MILLLQRHDLLLQVRMISRPVRSPTCAEARVLVAAEVALADLAVLGAVEQRAVGLSSHTGRRFLACSSAMRQLLRNLPPRMVSPKWTCQLSLVLTLRIAAAQPPSAMTGVGLAEQRLGHHGDAQALFARLDDRAAPAPPAPITTTSYW